MRVWLLVLLVAFVTRLPALTDRFYSNDEATYSALAARLNAGGSLYTDAVDHKPPGIASVYAAVFAASGQYDLWAVRALLVAVVGATGIAIGELAFVLTGDERSRMAGVLYALAAATGFPDNVQAANTELFLNLPLALAALAVHRGTVSAGAGAALACALAAGALTGVAAVFKYQSALAGGAWLYAAYTQRRRPAIAAALTAGLAVGFAAIAAAVLWHYAAAGHLDAFLFWGWRYNFVYIASMPLGRQAGRAAVRTAVIAAFWSPVLVLALRRPARQGAHERSLIVAWAVAMAIAVTAGGRYFGNYYLMVLPPLCVLAAWLPVPRGVLAAACAFAAASLAAATFWFTIKPDARHEDQRYRVLGAWLRDHSAPDDRPFVWGDAAQIYIYGQRVMGTRFAFTNYHAGKIWGTGADEADAPARPDLEVPRAWTELLDDVRRAPPAFIVDTAAAGLHGFGGHALDRYPAIWHIVESKYRLAATIDGVPIYERATRRALTIYFVDVEGGQSTLIVAPSGASLLVDAGYAGGRDAARIAAAAKDAGIARIDTLLVTHFHSDHAGGVPDLAARLPIGRFVDYGQPGGDPNAVAPFEAYRAVRASGSHVVPRPGDAIPFDGVDVRVVSAGGSLLDRPIDGMGAATPACEGYRRQADDPSENARSLGIRVAFGRFRFIDLGDLNWNPLGRLVCPNDLIGRADVLLMPHHTNVDATVPAMLAALAPRVVVSNNGPTKGGMPEALALLGALNGVDVWQLHKALAPNAPNAEDDRLANVDDGQTSYWIKVVAREDGSFTVTNQRNARVRAYRSPSR